jgi:hypothetical protein
MLADSTLATRSPRVISAHPPRVAVTNIHVRTCMDNTVLWLCYVILT